MKNIYLFILALPIKVFPFTNHVFEFFFQIMVIDMLFNNKFQIFFIWKEYRVMVLTPLETEQGRNMEEKCQTLKCWSFKCVIDVSHSFMEI